MQDRAIYEKSLSGYPDLLTLSDLQTVLGGVCEKTVRDIVRRGEIKYFKDGPQYKIPKEYVIDYMLTDSGRKTMKRKMEEKQLVDLKRDLILHRDRLLAFCSSPRSKKEMMLFLNLKSVKLFYSLFLHPLLETGELHWKRCYYENSTGMASGNQRCRDYRHVSCGIPYRFPDA